jgi:hypothetical protein
MVPTILSVIKSLYDYRIDVFLSQELLIFSFNRNADDRLDDDESTRGV